MNPIILEKENEKLLLEVPFEPAAHQTFELEEEEEDELNLSFHSHKSHPGARSNRFQAFLTLFKSFVGSAIFTVPYSFQKAGGGLATIIIAFCGFLALYCMMLAIKVADDRPLKGRVTLEKLTFDILGNWGKRSVQVTMIIMQVGVCIGVFILASQFLDYSFCEYGIDSLCKNTLFKVLLFAGLTMPISFINNAHYFYIPSLAGTLFLLITIGAQFYYNAQLISEQDNYGHTLYETFTTFKWEQMPSMFGVATYAFEGIGTLFSIRGAMAKPKYFSNILLIEMIILTLLLLTFSAFCATALLTKLPEIALFSLPRDNYFYLVLQIGVVCSNLISYPIQLFPAVMILEHTNTLRKRLFNEKGETKSILMRYGLRVVLISIMIFVAFTAKSFNLFLNILGSCIFTYIGYILPVMIYQKHFQKLRKRRLALNGFVVVVSIVLGAVGTVLAFIELVNYESEEGEI